ncbi:transcriptional repressor [Aerococcaceae bacterium NML201209]|nr:transcriptional repressor [Aerococcaceae bacterium NML201209]MCW6666800.1 transcriptional repressor [Aerococcaceae bacterium NML190938]
MCPHGKKAEDILSEVLLSLKEKNFRITPQRKAILLYLIQSSHHPSVEDIYHDLLPEHPSMSLATVYNNLRVLVDEGLVYEMKFSGVTSHFDFIGHKHYHVICDQCGKITDVSHIDLSFIHQMVHEQTDYSVNDTHLEIHGLCPQCRPKNTHNTSPN